VITSVTPTVPESVSEYVASPDALVTIVDDAVAPLRPATVNATEVLPTPAPN